VDGVHNEKNNSASVLAVALSRRGGIVCDVVNYLDTPPSSSELMQLLDQLRRLMNVQGFEFRIVGSPDPKRVQTDPWNARLARHLLQVKPRHN